MKRTTIYLPDDLKRAVEETAAREARTEADVIRDAVADAMRRRTPPKPTIPISTSGLGDPDIAEQTDEHLEDFGR